MLMTSVGQASLRVLDMETLVPLSHWMNEQPRCIPSAPQSSVTSAPAKAGKEIQAVFEGKSQRWPARRDSTLVLTSYRLQATYRPSEGHRSFGRYADQAASDDRFPVTSQPLDATQRIDLRALFK
jgi:hypothetical protein